jgi:hypothetical protein
MPQGLEVGFSHGDNSSFELAGYVNSVVHERKSDFDPEVDPTADTDMILAQPEEWISLRG